MISFSEYFSTVNELEYLFNKNDYIEDFLEDVSTAGIGIDAVTTSDIAANSLPLGMMKRKKPIRYEELKNNKNAQKFIEENLDKYKSIYKKDTNMVINSVAEHLFLR